MPTPKKKSVQEARDQAADYFGTVASVILVVGGQDYEIPNPQMLDDDQQVAYDALQFELGQCDREPESVIEVPEKTLTDADGHAIKTAGYTVKEGGKNLLQPYRKDGVLMSPPYNVKLAIALWGEERYEQFKKDGGRSSQIAIEWASMVKALEERQKHDPKSAGSAGDLEAVPAGD